MMPRLMITGLAGVLALLAFGWGQEAHTAASIGTASNTIAQIRFTFDHPQLVPSHYVIVVNEDGQGHYQSSENPDTANARSTSLVSQPLNRDITVSGPTRDMLFSTARQRKLFAIPCESNTGKVAFRGNKELSYQGQEGQGSCQFNWSKDQQIDKLTNFFQSLAFTLEEGDRLAVEHRHDRLALDEELQVLVLAAKSDRAMEIQNIAPQLEAIAQDETVMARARQRARQLLQVASGADPHSN